MTTRAKTTPASTAGSFAPDMKAEPDLNLDTPPERGTLNICSGLTSAGLAELDNRGFLDSEGWPLLSASSLKVGDTFNIGGSHLTITELIPDGRRVTIVGFFGDDISEVDEISLDRSEKIGVLSRGNPDDFDIDPETGTPLVPVSSLQMGDLIFHDGVPVTYFAHDENMMVRHPSGEVEFVALNEEGFQVPVAVMVELPEAQQTMIRFTSQVGASSVLAMSAIPQDETAVRAAQTGDHFRLASYLGVLPQNLLSHDGKNHAKLEAHQRMFGLYGEYSKFRDKRSWSEDETLNEARRTASMEDLAWDRALGIRIEVERECRKLLGTAQRTEAQLGDKVHEILLSISGGEMDQQSRRTMIDYALRFGPYGKYRRLIDSEN